LWADGREEQAKSMIPLGRIGSPDDFVEAAVFLASGNSAWVTGQVLVVDGGTTA
jgi:3-oxoacyl-[acyl-carrier protein] reductase